MFAYRFTPGTHLLHKHWVYSKITSYATQISSFCLPLISLCKTQHNFHTELAKWPSLGHMPQKTFIRGENETYDYLRSVEASMGEFLN